MSEISQQSGGRSIQARAVDVVIHVGLLVLLVLWCFNIIRPFIMPVLWAAIFAVALYPVFMKLQTIIGGHEKTAATLITILALGLLITPTLILSNSLIEGAMTVSDHIKAGTLSVPPPPEYVKDWPIVGNTLNKTWNLASTNLSSALHKFEPQLEAVGVKLLSGAAGASMGILMFIIAIIISGVFLVYAGNGRQMSEAIASRLMGKDNGKKVVDLASATIRSVAQGVLGVALIQAIFAGIGLLVMNVPYAGLWAFLVLLMAVIQLSPLLILGPIIVYVFSVAATVPAVLFMVWSVIVSVGDGILKPLFLGRGMDIPMLVILLGAIGGLILSGIIGLFIGAVVLAVGYKFFMAWLSNDEALHKTNEN